MELLHVFTPRFIVFFRIFRRFYIAGQLWIAYFCKHLTGGYLYTLN